MDSDSINQVMSEELTAKVEQLFVLLNGAGTPVIGPFSMAGECALLSGGKGVERHEVYEMAKAIRSITALHGVTTRR